MCLLKEDKDFRYGICLNSCDCEVIEGIKKTCRVYTGSLVKLFEFNQNTSVGLTLLNDRYKLDLAKSLCVNSIAPKLFKYLNAINEYKERLEFYRNNERREFVLHLKKDNIVCVRFSNKKQTKAVFRELNEKQEKIFITVELLENPSSIIKHCLQGVINKYSTNNLIYSLPANIIRTFPFLDIDENNYANLQNDKILHERCSSQKDNRDIFQEKGQSNNYNTSNVSINKFIAGGVEPPKTKITSQNSAGSGRLENYDEPYKNKTLVTSYNKASNDEPKNDITGVAVEQSTKYNENRYETPVDLDIQINSKLCIVCKNLNESNICLSCDLEKTSGQNNSESSIDLNISLDSSLSRETPINSLEVNSHQEINNCVTNDQYLESFGSVQTPTRNNDYSTLEYWRCIGNVQNGTTSIVSIAETVSKEIFFSQNLDGSGVQPIGKPVKRNAKLDENLCETRIGSALILPSSSSTDKPINSSHCIACFINVSDDDICRSCTNEINRKIVSNKSLDSSLSSESPITPLEINTLVTNEDDIPDKSKIPEYEQPKTSCKQQCFEKNCSGYYLWEEFGEERPITFMCNKCKLDNCLKCVTIHVNLTCGQYEKISNSADKDTVELFLAWIREGLAMPCPNCEALIEKDEGCDWVQCLMCNIEICWATRGPRWGPGGNGDTSGGCGCVFKVKKCVENCNYCH